MEERRMLATETVRLVGLRVVLAAVGVLAAVTALTADPGRRGVPLAATAAALLAAAATFVGRERLAESGWHAMLAVATVATTAVVLVDGGGGATIAGLLLYAWIVGLAAFVGRRSMLVHGVGAGLVAGLALVAAGLGQPVVAWVGLALTLAACAAVIRGLVEERRRLAGTDTLTQTATGPLWATVLSHECVRAARTQHPLCVAVLSLDGFRDYAFERGHAAAEQLLAETAQAWRGVLREGDLMGHLRADEFAVLLPECGIAAARLVVERVRQSTPDGKLALSGIVCWDGDEPPDRLIDRAYEALGTARRSGRSTPIATA